MPNRLGAVDEASIAGRRIQLELCAELRNARLARGLSQADVARALGVSHARISRARAGARQGSRHLGPCSPRRRGRAPSHIRFFPAGGGLRDAAQLDLLRRFRARIGDRWSWQLEAPLNIAGDLRAFDAAARREEALRIAVEAITRLRDAQAQLRAATLKQRDGKGGRLVLLVKKSERTGEPSRSAATSWPRVPALHPCHARSAGARRRPRRQRDRAALALRMVAP